MSGHLKEKCLNNPYSVKFIFITHKTLFNLKWSGILIINHVYMISNFFIRYVQLEIANQRRALGSCMKFEGLYMNKFILFWDISDHHPTTYYHVIFWHTPPPPLMTSFMYKITKKMFGIPSNYGKRITYLGPLHHL